MWVNMTEVIKVTSKGQVTLPADVRKKLHLDKDTYIAVDIIGDYIILKKIGLKLKELSDIIQKNAKENKITRKEIEKAILDSRKKVWA
jgi:AbrB family looped-hinge helix DNA binding protein